MDIVSWLNIQFNTVIQYKCCVVMWYDSNASCYGDMNYKINKTYCDKHNIEIIYCHERRRPDRHPAWERIPLILKHLHKYDYVIWIDSDAHFYIDSENIVDFIRAHDSHDFIFSSDWSYLKPTCIPVGINTGIYIVKNTPYSIGFLTKWVGDEILYANNRFPHWWDQGVLVDMYKENVLNIQNHCCVIDYGILQHFCENEVFGHRPFIFHLAGKDSAVRYEHAFDYSMDAGIAFAW